MKYLFTLLISVCILTLSVVGLANMDMGMSMRLGGSGSTGNVYYMRVDGTAVDKTTAIGPCSSVSDTMSIATHDADTFVAGDIIKLCDDGGNYTTQMDMPSSGSSALQISYRAQTGDTPVIDGGTSVDYGISVAGKDYVSIKGITVQNHDVAEIYISTGGTGVVIEDCTVTVSAGGGIKVITDSGGSALSGITIDNNTVTSFTTDHGIQVTANNNTLTNIVISNNTINTGGDSSGIFINAHTGGTLTGTNEVNNNIVATVGQSGISVIGLASGTLDVYKNDISDTSRDTVDTGMIHIADSTGGAIEVYDNVLYEQDDVTADWQSAGVYIDTAASATISVFRNYLYDNNGIGLRAYNADSVKFYHNVIDNVGKDDTDVTYRSGAIAFHSGAADTADTNIAYNNTIYMSVNTQNSYAIQVMQVGGGTVAGNLIKNNIIWNNNVAGVPYIWNEDDATAGIDYNMYYPNISTAEMRYNATDYNSFGTWQSAGYDINGYETNPLFSDAELNDFTLGGVSPAIDEGEDLGSTYVNALDPGSTWPDNVSTLSQDSYGSGWDIGAYIDDTTPTVSAILWNNGDTILWNNGDTMLWNE